MSTPPMIVDAASPVFNSLLSSDDGARVLAESDLELFHEAGVWMPRTSEYLVTSNRLNPGTPEEHVRISAIHWPTGRVRRLEHLEKQILMANGGTTDFEGGAFLLSQGMYDTSGSIWHVDADLSTATRLGPPDGIVLNSPNDIVYHRGSKSLLFTDPAYGFVAQGFRTDVPLSNQKTVWCTGSTPELSSQQSDWRMLHSGFTEQPNGILFSPSEKTVYVSDVWHPDWVTKGHKRLAREASAPQEGVARKILCYDLEVASGSTVSHSALDLAARRVFFDLEATGAANETGYPDGLKCDQHGNVYAGCGDGVRVYAPTAEYLGRLGIPGGVANLAFGGPDGRTLLVFNERRAIAIPMAISGALGPFSS